MSTQCIVGKLCGLDTFSAWSERVKSNGWRECKEGLTTLHKEIRVVTKGRFNIGIMRLVHYPITCFHVTQLHYLRNQLLTSSSTSCPSTVKYRVWLRNVNKVITVGHCHVYTSQTILFCSRDQTVRDYGIKTGGEASTIVGRLWINSDGV